MTKYFKFENGLILGVNTDLEVEIGKKYFIVYDEDGEEGSLLTLVAIANELHELDYSCVICGDIENLEEVEDTTTGVKEYVCEDCLNGEDLC